jgi:hypothetical protein
MVSAEMKISTKKISTMNRIQNHIDLIVAGVVLFIGITGFYLAITMKWRYLIVGLPFTISSILYYLCKNRSDGRSLDMFHFTQLQKERFLKVTNILSLLVFCVSLISTHNTEYNVSSIFVVSIIFLVFSILICITLQEKTYLTLIKLVILSYYIQMATLFEFPGLIGIDPLFHAEMISRIISTFHIVPYNQYANYPIMHILVVTTSLISNTSIKDSMALCISFPYTLIEIILIYLIGILLYDSTIALIGGLIFGISNVAFIYGSYNTIPTTLGIIFFSFIFYFLFKSFLRGRNSRNNSTMIFIFFVQIITHTISSVVTVLAQFCLIIFDNFYNKFFKSKNVMLTSIYYLLILVTSLIAYWIFVSGFYMYVVKAFTLDLSLDHLKGQYIFLDDPFSFRHFADYMDQVLLYMFAIFGSLKVLDKKIINQERFLHMSTGMSILCIATVGVAFSFNAIIPSRWYVFSLFLLSIHMALGIVYLVKGINNKLLKFSLLILLLFSITFFNITGTSSNVIGNTEANPVSVRNGLYESEIISAKTIISRFDTDPLTDMYYQLYITNNLNSSTKESISQEDSLKMPTITSYLLDKDLDKTHKKLIIRSDLFNKPFIDYKGIAKINYNLVDLLQSNHRSLIYNSKTVFLYT